MTDYDALAKSAYNKQQAIKHLTASLCRGWRHVIWVIGGKQCLVT